MSEYKDPSKPAQFETPPPPQPKGMSGCVKALVVLLVVGAVGLVVCCGVGWFVVRPQAFSTDPARVRQGAEEIINMDIPAEWKPTFYLNFLPIRGLSMFRMGMFMTPDKDGFLVLMDFQGQMGDLDQARLQMERSMQQGFNSDQNIEKTTQLETSEREIEIRGEKVPFSFTKSEGMESKQVFWEVAGLIQGNERPTLIYLRVRETVMTLDQIEQMLRSIR